MQDIAALIDVYSTLHSDPFDIPRIARERLGLAVDFLPVSEMPPPGPKPFFSLLDQSLSEEISKQIVGRSGSTRSGARRWSRSASGSTTR